MTTALVAGVVVCAPTLTRDAVVRALIEGAYYSSSGPAIDNWGVRDGHVWVECSPCERVNMVAGGFINAGSTVIAESDEGTLSCRVCTARR